MALEQNAKGLALSAVMVLIPSSQRLGETWELSGRRSMGGVDFCVDLGSTQRKKKS